MNTHAQTCPASPSTASPRTGSSHYGHTHTPYVPFSSLSPSHLLSANQSKVNLIKSANNKKWNNANPRGTDTNSIYKSSVPAEVFAKYERAEAAHKNLLENAPLFVGAVGMGCWAGLAPGEFFTVLFYFWVLKKREGKGLGDLGRVRQGVIRKRADELF